jgi:phage FluMu protein Com
MPISQFRCPECDKTVKMAKPRPAGTKVRCPKCEAVVTLEDDEEALAERPVRKAAKGGAFDEDRPARRSRRQEDDEDERP